MVNDVTTTLGSAADIGRCLREIYGEMYGDLDDRMLELLHELDFVASSCDTCTMASNPILMD